MFDGFQYISCNGGRFTWRQTSGTHGLNIPKGGARPAFLRCVGVLALLGSYLVCLGQVSLIIERNDSESVSASFSFKRVPAPSRSDAATDAKFSIVDGELDQNGHGFGNTFYSEIDVVERNGAAPLPVASSQKCQQVFEAGGGAYEIIVDTCETPDLLEWAQKELAPMAQEWYPKIVKLLPSGGYQAPSKVTISLSQEMKGVAATSGTRVRCAAEWFRRNLKGEAVGAVFHELVHVVQNYGQARRSNPDAVRPPGWLVEGIPDYIRWFTFEPQSHGADAQWLRGRKNLSLRYDAGYRITANFLNWTTEKYAQDIVPRLNAALRQGKNSEEVWKERTGHSVQELGEEWKKETEEKLRTTP